MIKKEDRLVIGRAQYAQLGDLGFREDCREGTDFREICVVPNVMQHTLRGPWPFRTYHLRATLLPSEEVEGKAVYEVRGSAYATEIMEAKARVGVRDVSLIIHALGTEPDYYGLVDL